MYEFTSRDIERYAGIPQVILRDWRRRKILSDTVGVEVASGRWRYSLREVVYFAVGKFLSEDLLSLKTAFEASQGVHRLLIARLWGQDQLAGSTLKTHRYVCFWKPDPEAKHHELDLVGEAADTIEQAVAARPGDALGARTLVLDLDELAAELPENLIDLIKRRRPDRRGEGIA